MPSIRRGSSQPPNRVMRNGAEVTRIMRGTVEHWVNYREQEMLLTNAGMHDLSVPSWCKHIDIIMLGGGGGGRQGNGGNNVNGQGGSAGSYLHASVDRPGGLTVAVRVGAGGGGSYENGTSNQEDGESSRLWIGGLLVYEAPGGTNASSGSRLGGDPGNRSFAGHTMVGGTPATGGGFSGSGAPPGGTSTPPGAGGPGGTGGLVGLYQHGGAGARGEVWMRMRSGPRQ